MNSVSNQHSYTELKPLPIQKDNYPKLRVMIAKVCMLALASGFTAPLVAGTAFLGWGFSIVTSGVAGAVAALISSLVTVYFYTVPSRVCQYRVDTVKQIESTLANGKALNAAKGLIEVFALPLRGFEFPMHYHYLHRLISMITLYHEKTRSDVQEVWKTFLTHLHGTKIDNEAELDLSIDLARLKGDEIDLKASFLQKGWFSDVDEEDLRQIEAIQTISFGETERLSREEIKDRIAKGQCIVVRGQGKIFGYCLYTHHYGTVQIDQIARKPNAACLSIGSILLYTLLNHQYEETKIQLYCPSSNPSISLFYRWGFEEKPSAEKNKLLMQLNWKTFQKIVNATL